MNTARIRGILAAPRTEWETIATERPEPRDLWIGWVIPLALIGPVAGLIGGLVFGSPLGSLFGVRVGLRYHLQAAVTGFVGSLVGVALVAFLARALAPSFGAKCEGTSGLRLAAYSFTAAWLAGIFSLVPMLAPLSLVGLYSIYLLYLGVRPLTGVPEEKALSYAAALIASGALAMLLFGWVLA